VLFVLERLGKVSGSSDATERTRHDAGRH
jgi:hypothetical protein